jgi:hypothetical protein
VNKGDGKRKKNTKNQKKNTLKPNTNQIHSLGYTKPIESNLGETHGVETKE